MGYPIGPADLPGIVPNDEGWMHDVEVAVVLGFAQVLASNLIAECGAEFRVLEVGCYRGRTTSALLKSLDLRVTVIDNFKGPADRPPEENLRARFLQNLHAVPLPGVVGLVHKLRVLVGDSVERMDLLQKEGAEFGLILIDGDHSRAGVRRDTLAAWPLLAEGGYLFFDDIDSDGVKTGIAEAFREIQNHVPAVIAATHKLGYLRKCCGRPVP